MSLWTGWKFKPPQGTPIDWTHPYAQGLVAAWAFNEGSGTPVELIGCRAASASTGVAWKNSTDSCVLYANSGVSTDIEYSGVPAVGPAISIALRCNFQAGPGGDFMLVERSIVNQTWAMLNESSVLEWRGASANNRNSFSSSGIATAGPLFDLCISDTGTGTGTSGTSTFYLNGVPQTNGASGGTAPASNTNVIHFANWDNTAYYANIYLSYCYIYNWAIPQSMAAGIAANPWQIFAPPLPFWWGHSASGAPTAFLSYPHFDRNHRQEYWN